MASVIGLEGRRPERKRPQTQGNGIRARRDVGELISLEVIPRLLVAHRMRLPDSGLKAEAASAPMLREEAKRLAPMAVRCEAGELLAEVEAILRRGVPAERLFIDLLAPAARMLGEAWERDSVDFVEVTMGLWRLQEVLREIAARAPRASGGGRTALFAPLPGDGHSFGAAMVQESFALAGWEADFVADPSRADLLEAVGARPLDLVALTITCDIPNEPVASLLRAVRSVSMNPHLSILVGGRVPAANPHFALLVGADGTAATCEEAVRVAERLVEGACRAAAV
jgi:MerR family transcriptional regulator, light-induced transcriptional regulator